MAQKILSSATSKCRVQALLDTIYPIVKKQRFKDVAVIKFDEKPRFYIIASSFNDRHLLNGTQEINKVLKPDHYASSVSVADGWNVLDYEDVIIHLFSRAVRQHFDIEQLWSVGPEYDSHMAQLRRSQEELSEYKLEEPPRID